MSAKKISRRDIFRTGGLTAAAGVLAGRAPAARAAAAAATSRTANIYTRIGVRPFINCTATLTINSGTLTLPEVKEAMDEASRYSVNMDELMEKVGERLAQLLGSEYAIVTAGAAAAATHGTAACVAGADPEKMKQLPDLTHLKNEVIMPRQSRNVYDHAIRSTGVKMIEIDTREDFLAALGKRTAMVAVLAAGEAAGKMRLEEIAEIAHKAGVPVLVDAAAYIPSLPNPYLSRGADLVCYSGGKIIRGPQCSGLLLGRKDLVRAAWINSAPHHAFGRALKVGKEEIMGQLAAIETLMSKRDIPGDYRTWEGWYAYMDKTLTPLGGIQTKVLPGNGGGPFPSINIDWDPEKYGLTAREMGERLLSGEPRIMSHAAGEGHSLLIRPACMQTGDEKLVTARLVEIFRQAGPRAPRPQRPPAASLAGRWDVDVQFISGRARHTLFLEQDGNKVTGSHEGTRLKGDLAGAIDGDQVRFRSGFRYEGSGLSYTFIGKLNGDAIEGEVELDEYGKATFTARRHRYEGRARG
jgi:D-glucosaminate-6-phosphate ammonia-lyase